MEIVKKALKKVKINVLLWREWMFVEKNSKTYKIDSMSIQCHNMCWCIYLFMFPYKLSQLPFAMNSSLLSDLSCCLAGAVSNLCRSFTIVCPCALSPETTHPFGTKPHNLHPGIKEKVIKVPRTLISDKTFRLPISLYQVQFLSRCRSQFRFHHHN